MFKLDERMKTIADHYGFEAQAEKSIEEMAELIVEIKHMNKGMVSPNFQKFVEELADVKIMIDQLYFLSNFDGDVSKEIERKLQRQMKRIEKEKEVKKDVCA